MEFQSKCWVKSLNLGQPFKVFVKGKCGRGGGVSGGAWERGRASDHVARAPWDRDLFHRQQVCLAPGLAAAGAHRRQRAKPALHLLMEARDAPEPTRP
jgi:hypothetical protein